MIVVSVPKISVEEIPAKFMELLAPLRKAIAQASPALVSAGQTLQPVLTQASLTQESGAEVKITHPRSCKTAVEGFCPGASHCMGMTAGGRSQLSSGKESSRN